MLIEDSILEMIKGKRLCYLSSKDDLADICVKLREPPGFSRWDELSPIKHKDLPSLSEDSYLFEVIDIMRAKGAEINPENFLEEAVEYRNELLPSTYIAEINPVIFYKALLERFPNYIGVLADMGQNPMEIPDQAEDLPKALYEVYKKVETQLTSKIMELWWKDVQIDSKKIPALMKALNPEVMMKKEREKNKEKQKQEKEEMEPQKRPKWSR